MSVNDRPQETDGKSQMRRERVRAATKALLGSMMRDAECIGDVLQIIRAEHIRSEPNHSIFAAAVRLYGRGSGVDTVTLGEELRKTGEMDRHGPQLMAYLVECWDEVPYAAHAQHYATIVRDHAIVSDLEAVGKGIAADAEAHARPADELLEDAERQVFAIAEQGVIGRAVPLAEVLDETAKAYDARSVAAAAGGPSGGLPTGFDALDTILAGGLPDGSLTILAARPSLGKTALGICIASNVARRGDGVLFVSLEQSRLELADRLLAAAGSVDSFGIRVGRLRPAEKTRLMDAHDALRQAKLWIDDSPGQTALRIGANARRMKHRHNIRLLVIDYLGLIESEDRKANRQEQVAGISRRLKGLAREMNIPVLCLAQLNREVEHRSGDARPKLADLRDSGAVEQDADIVILLYREAAQTVLPEPRVEAIVAKQRNGATGTVNLLFRKRFVRFEEWEQAPDFNVSD